MTAKEFLTALPSVGAKVEWHAFDKKTNRTLTDQEFENAAHGDTDAETWDCDMTIFWNLAAGGTPERIKTNELMGFWSVNQNQLAIIEQYMTDQIEDTDLRDWRVPF